MGSETSPLRIWHVGNWCIQLGQTSVETKCLMLHPDFFHRAKCGDDLIESTSGYPVRCKDPAHLSVQGLDWATLPPLLGFNETRLRPRCTAHVEIENPGKWSPLPAIREYGKGRVTCWTTSTSPHWGINIMKWRHYPRFWKQVFAP